MVEIKDMLVDDLNESVKLWASIPELKFPSSFDTEERLTRFIYKNERFSSIARTENEIIGGAVLCGNDGRRGFFYHIGVKP